MAAPGVRCVPPNAASHNLTKPSTRESLWYGRNLTRLSYVPEPSLLAQGYPWQSPQPDKGIALRQPAWHSISRHDSPWLSPSVTGKGEVQLGGRAARPR